MRFRVAAVGVLALLVVLASTGCGVTLREDHEGTELFKRLTISGERRAGSELTVDLVVTQVYPVPVWVACFYEDSKRLTDDQKRLAFQERAIRIGDTVLPAAAGRRPDEKGPEQRISFRFSIPKPGEYFLACMTPAAMENGLGTPLTIR